MYAYIKGRVIEQMGASIILENNNIGYLINVPNPYSYEMNIEYKVYIYEHIREDEHSLYGFKTLDELELFLKLLGVKGIGPKMAMPILATGSISGIIDAIERENLLYLRKFPKIGEKVAKQIILDLKGKIKMDNINDNKTIDELRDVLFGLGYKEKEFSGILNKVNNNLPLEEQIKEALKLLTY